MRAASTITWQKERKMISTKNPQRKFFAAAADAKN